MISLTKSGRSFCSAILSTTFLISISAIAEDFYVDSDVALITALKKASTNRQDDNIYINTKKLEISDPVVYSPDNDETYSINIQPAPGLKDRVYIDRKISETAFSFDFSKYHKLKKIDINISDIVFEDFYRNNDKRKSYFAINGDNIHLKVDNCRFVRANTEDSGGAFDINTNSSFIEFIGNVFVKNAADKFASSISIKGKGNRVIIDRNRFISGKAENGGAVYLKQKNGSIFVLNNTFLGNKLVRSSGENGGGIKVDSDGANIYLINNYFFANIGNKAGGGAYIENENGYSYFSKNRFIYNYVRNESGGGLYYKTKNGNLEIIDNRFEYNMSNSGAGVKIDAINSDILMGNNIVQQNIAGNYSKSDGKNGGGVFIKLTASDLLLTNNTIYLNSASSNGGGVYISTDENSKTTIANNIIWRNYTYKNEESGHDMYINNKSAVSILNNDFIFLVATEEDLLDVARNIDNDPEFLNPYAGNLHLSSNSPCIDAGVILDDKRFIKLKEDIDGDERILENSIDIGADEFSGGNDKEDKKIIIIENPEKNDENTAFPAYTSSSIVEPDKEISLVCVDLNPKKPISSYAWDLDGDGFIDKKTEKSMITVNRSQIKDVKCLITYYDGTQALARLDKKEQ